MNTIRNENIFKSIKECIKYITDRRKMIDHDTEVNNGIQS